VQVVIIPISERHEEKAKEVKEILEKAGVRVEIDNRRETLGYRVRQAQLQKIPYMVILGDKEVASERISLRTRNGKEYKDVSLEGFVAKVTEEIRDRKNELSL